MEGASGAEPCLVFANNPGALTFETGADFKTRGLLPSRTAALMGLIIGLFSLCETLSLQLVPPAEDGWEELVGLALTGESSGRLVLVVLSRWERYGEGTAVVAAEVQ